MFDAGLAIFLITSAIFVAPMWGNISALQFFQFGVIGNVGYNYPQLLFFEFGVLSLFILALFTKPQREFNDNPARFFIIAIVLSLIFHPISLRMFWVIFLGIVLYYLVTVYTKNYKRILKAVVFVSILNTVFALLQAIGIHLIYAPTGRIDGLMCTSTHLGIYQAIALPVCYSINPYLIIVPFISILLSKSITATLMLLGYLSYLLRKRIFSHGIIPFMLVCSICFIFGVWVSPVIWEKLKIRFLAWSPMLQGFFNRPYIGNGIKTIAIKTSAGMFDNPQSVYIQLAYYGGVSFLIPIYFFIRDKLKCLDKTLVIFFIMALFAGIEKSYFDFPRLAATVIILTAFMNITKGESDVA